LSHMLRRFVFPAVLVVAGYYALFGGEYTVLDLRGVQAETQEATEKLQDLRAVTDSLTLRVDSLDHDDQTLEALARERFGMIRDGEILYRYTGDPDTDGEDPSGT